jgi:hypothetical protein
MGQMIRQKFASFKLDSGHQSHREENTTPAGIRKRKISQVHSGRIRTHVIGLRGRCDNHLAILANLG